jgi:dipeptidyl aminopeptidase/acylaminoacyl peptidase
MRFTTSLSALLVSPLLLPFAASSSAAQETPSNELLTVEHYLDMERVGDPQLSPDGRQLVFARSWIDKMNDQWESAIWIMNADGSRARFLVDGSRPRWSPDGTRIAFLAPGEPRGSQVHVRWMDAEGAVTQVTRETETPRSHEWSPDGESILFLRLVPDSMEFSIDLPEAPEGARWTEAPRFIDRIHYRRDRAGFLEEGFTHIFTVPAEGGTGRQLTFGKWSVGGFDVAPNGAVAVFDGLMEEDADGRYRESHIYALDVASGNIRQLTSTKGPWSSPVVSPDGRHVAFVGFEWTPQSYKTNELYLIGIDGEGMRQISGDLDRDPRGLRWAANGNGVYFVAQDRGTQNLHFAELEGGVRQITEGNHVLSPGSMTRGGLVAATVTSYHEPGDVVVFNVRRPDRITRLTHVNLDVLEAIRLGEVEEIWYESSGGARVQGWIVKPPDFDPSQRYPLILHIHGGPHSMYTAGFNYSFQNFAANGYVVLYTNPRGSTGYGTEFANAIDNGYPSVDYDDLMAGVDTLIARGYVNPDQMYPTGVSGGGVLSAWIIGHTDRFAAAAVRAPVINWMSFAGTTDITAWGYYRYEGYPWTNPDKFLEHSPLMYAGNVTTPTILMTGELDLRTPMSQTEEFYQALKQQAVSTMMVRFNEEYHGTGSKPSNFMRTQLYLMKWFEQHGGDPPRMVSGRGR